MIQRQLKLKLTKKQEEAFDLEGNKRYEALHVSDLGQIENQVKAELRGEGVQDSFMIKGVIKARVIDKLMGVNQHKEIKQERLF